MKKNKKVTNKSVKMNEMQKNTSKYNEKVEDSKKLKKMTYGYAIAGFFVLIALIVGGLYYSISYYQNSKERNSNKDIPQSKVQKETLKSKGYSEKEISKMDDKEVSKSIGTNEDYDYIDFIPYKKGSKGPVVPFNNNDGLGDVSGKMFDASEVKKYVHDLYILEAKSDFPTIRKQIENDINKGVLFAGQSRQIATIYEDTLTVLEMNQVQGQGKSIVAKKLRDPITKIIVTYLLPQEYRASLIVDKSSISPIASKEFSLNSYTTVSEEEENNFVTESINNIYGDDIMYLYKVNADVGPDNYIIYAVQKNDGSSEVFGAYPTSKENYEKSVEYWDELNNELE